MTCANHLNNFTVERLGIFTPTVENQMEAQKDNDITEAGMTRRFLLGTVSVNALLGELGGPAKDTCADIYQKIRLHVFSHSNSLP